MCIYIRWWARGRLRNVTLTWAGGRLSIISIWPLFPLAADHDLELITSDVKISDSLSKIGSLVGFGASHYLGLIYHSLVHKSWSTLTKGLSSSLSSPLEERAKYPDCIGSISSQPQMTGDNHATCLYTIGSCRNHHLVSCLMPITYLIFVTSPRARLV